METIQRLVRSLHGSHRKSHSNSGSRPASATNTSTQSSDPSSYLRNCSGAPHPIFAGAEGKACPISGLFADAPALEVGDFAGLAAFSSDPDMAEEIRMLTMQCERTQMRREVQTIASSPVQLLHFKGGHHYPSLATRQLVSEVGLPRLLRFTESFYQKCFADSHVDKFIASHAEPHHERFAHWIQEKFGDGTPWTEERITRPKRFMRFGRQTEQVAHDRTSAHFAAWHSPKREPHKWGENFKPDDARVWLRLHFWAARETGMFEHEVFMEYYIRFIGHFIAVYSFKSPPFTRESARWSADPRNVQRYLESGRVMTDVIGKDVDKELAKLPDEERLYTGSQARDPAWPYEHRQTAFLN